MATFQKKFSDCKPCLLVLVMSSSILCVFAVTAEDAYHPRLLKDSGVDPGKPLFLTPYIESGKIEEGQNLSRVGELTGASLESYSGFLTVNKTLNSNMFFWFIPALNKPAIAPVLLWLQGGPGGSSLFGLFFENGPFNISEDLKLHPREWAWSNNYSMLYIDNPVGAGFSFTGNDFGYATNEHDVARDLYSALTQFFQLFPQYQKNEFYVTGESYAGKYIPAISYKIHIENPFANTYINLQGMAIGDGIIDPYSMFTDYGELFYQTGQIDAKEKKVVDKYTAKIAEYIEQKQWRKAFEQFDMLINGQFWPYPTYFYNVTGSSNIYNILRSTEAKGKNYYKSYVVLPEVRKAIHVGNLTYHGILKVERFLLEDICQSVKDWVAVVANNYRCLFYSGQLDIAVGATLTENFLQTLVWEGQAGYLNATKLIWKVHPGDTEVAGYVRRYKDFYQVIVRGGGHLLPFDQPERSMDMIDRFINKIPFAS